jgi:hypothetical protein
VSANESRNLNLFPFVFDLFHRKDARLPFQLQRAMAAEAEATREARAKVIAAEGEQRASRALKEAAEVIAGMIAQTLILIKPN